MPEDVYLKVGNSNVQLDLLFNNIEKAAQPTVGDLLYAGQRQRTRILGRTARGVDVNETTFHPYNTTRPVYYYPGKNAKNRRAAVTRKMRQLGLGKGHNSRSINASHFGARHQYAQRTHLGIKFSSYAAFKAAFGRLVVDLRGINAPHMLQAIIVQVKGYIIGGTEKGGGSFDNLEPANQITIGIYGDEAKRADGHNRGTRYLPKRRFLGANEIDKELVLHDIVTRVIFRLQRALRGTT